MGIILSGIFFGIIINKIINEDTIVGILISLEAGVDTVVFDLFLNQGA